MNSRHNLLWEKPFSKATNFYFFKLTTSHHKKKNHGNVESGVFDSENSNPTVGNACRREAYKRVCQQTPTCPREKERERLVEQVNLSRH